MNFKKTCLAQYDKLTNKWTIKFILPAAVYLTPSKKYVQGDHVYCCPPLIFVYFELEKYST